MGQRFLSVNDRASISRAMNSPTNRAFTLLEVVVATGVLGLSVVATMALQTAIHRSSSEVTDQSRAASFGDSITVELTRIRDREARRSGGDGNNTLADLIAPAAGTGLRLVASRDGSRLIDEVDADDPARGVARGDRYYLIEVSPQPPPLDYAAGAGFLAASCRVRWPYRLPTGADLSRSIAADLAQSSSVVLNVALTP